jgi:hypothetical protein
MINELEIITCSRRKKSKLKKFSISSQAAVFYHGCCQLLLVGDIDEVLSSQVWTYVTIINVNIRL